MCLIAKVNHWCTGPRHRKHMVARKASEADAQSRSRPSLAMRLHRPTACSPHPRSRGPKLTLQSVMLHSNTRGVTAPVHYKRLRLATAPDRMLHTSEHHTRTAAHPQSQCPSNPVFVVPSQVWNLSVNRPNIFFSWNIVSVTHPGIFFILLSKIRVLEYHYLPRSEPISLSPSVRSAVPGMTPERMTTDKIF